MKLKELKQILKVLEASNVPSPVSDSIKYKFYYGRDIPILLSEIERLNKIIDSMKEENK